MVIHSHLLIYDAQIDSPWPQSTHTHIWTSAETAANPSSPGDTFQGTKISMKLSISTYFKAKCRNTKEILKWYSDTPEVTQRYFIIRLRQREYEISLKNNFKKVIRSLKNTQKQIHEFWKIQTGHGWHFSSEIEILKRNQAKIEKWGIQYIK